MSTSQSHSEVVLELAEEFLERYRKGQRPSLKEYTDRHPDLADEIRDVFPAMAMMEKIAIPDVPSAIGPASAGSTPRTIGLNQLGDYRILREVGRGGMGIVYEAEQVSLGRQVALKLLPPQALRDPKQKRRFEREARAAARLHHTNIVPVFGVGEHDGTPYYVMQFIQGLGLEGVLDELRRMKVGAGPGAPSVTDRREKRNGSGVDVTAADIARSLVTGGFGPANQHDSEPCRAPETGPAPHTSDPPPGDGAQASDLPTFSSSAVSLPGESQGPDGRRAKAKRPTYWDGVARIGVQVADALEYAHNQGVVHRDIKPSNLLLDARGTVWVADFGLAKVNDQQDLTHTGDLLGTFRYMPPEAFEGKSGVLGDVYSLGLTLYELLALRPAFGEKDRARLVRQVTTGEADRLGRLNPEIPRDLETIVHKAIEREPSHRYASAGELAADLQRYLDDEPIEARRLSQAERLGRWSRRHKAVAALLATLGSVLTVGFAVMTILWTRAENSAAVAHSKEVEANRLAGTEAQARSQAQALEKTASERAESLASEDYINRVDRAYHEVEGSNIALAEDLLHGCPLERRGWEWHFVKRLCHLDRLTLVAGRPSVNAIAFSPDGAWIAVGSGEPIAGNRRAEADPGEVDLRNVATGERRRRFQGLKGAVASVAISPDGTLIAVGTGMTSPRVEARLTVWEVTSGRMLWSAVEPGAYLTSGLAFAPDGKSLAAGYGDYLGFFNGDLGRVKLWKVESGRETGALPVAIGGVSRLAYAPDGKRLAVAGTGVVEIWDVGARTRIHQLRGHNRWVLGLSFSPEGARLATGGWDRTIRIWDTSTGAEQRRIFGHDGFVLDLAFSPDGLRLASVSEDRSLRLWEIPSGREVETFHGHADLVQAVAFRPDGREVASGSLDGTVKFWDLQSSRSVVYSRHSGWVEDLAFLPNGRGIVSFPGRQSFQGDTPMRWNPATGEVDGKPGTAVPNEQDPNHARYGQKFAASRDGKLAAWTVDPSVLERNLSHRGQDYSRTAVELREVSTGRLRQTLIGHTAEVNSLVFSPDGRRLATASSDFTVKLWDTATGREMFTLRGHTGGVVCLAFSPDGLRLASGSMDHTARVWDATPLPPGVLDEQDARYRKKLAAFEQFRTAEDPARMATLHTLGGRWAQAAANLEKVIEQKPDNIVLRYQHIIALVEDGNRSGVRLACENIPKNSVDTTDMYQVMRLDGFRRLAPAAIDDKEKLKGLRGLLALNTWWHDILVQNGQADLAAVAFGKEIKDKPDNLEIRYFHILSLLEAGDLGGYRRAASDLLSRFGKATSPRVANSVAWYCVLAPEAVADRDAPIRMAEAARAGFAHATKGRALNTLGGALYRADRFDESIRRLEEGIKAGERGGLPQDWAFLAMAQYRRGNRAEAHRWLAKLRTSKPDNASGQFSWNDVEVGILRREAESVVPGGEPALP